MKLRLRLRFKKCKVFCIKLFHQEGSPESIARGAALGLLAAFLIPIGMHTIAILLLGFMFRCNKITAMGVTFLISNEITIPIIYPLQCIMGSYVIMDPLTYQEVKTMIAELCRNFSWKELWNLSKEVGIPYLIGGAIISALTMPPGYYISLSFVNRIRQRREAARMQNKANKHISSI